MELTDKNRTLEPPKGASLHAVHTDGGFIVLTYENMDEKQTIRVVLNDQGREVIRTVGDWIPQPVYRLPHTEPVVAEKLFWWERIFGGRK